MQGGLRHDGLTPSFDPRVHVINDMYHMLLHVKYRRRKCHSTANGTIEVNRV